MMRDIDAMRRVMAAWLACACMHIGYYSIIDRLLSLFARASSDSESAVNRAPHLYPAQQRTTLEGTLEHNKRA
jgi:hypothetical protein